MHETVTNPGGPDQVRVWVLGVGVGGLVAVVPGRFVGAADGRDVAPPVVWAAGGGALVGPAPVEGGDGGADVVAGGLDGVVSVGVDGATGGEPTVPTTGAFVSELPVTWLPARSIATQVSADPASTTAIQEPTATIHIRLLITTSSQP
ncbi:MAG TPA: hypothetical protein VHO29_09520 [Marmoricola sp.]|nr:hypothetical protein [Marmoricola sp.]